MVDATADTHTHTHTHRVGEAGILYIKIGKVTDVLYVDPPDLLLVARFDFLHAEIGLFNLTASIEKR